ncbi:MAG: NUDIX domain-containing protein [Cyclobacteriaceae bacterium]
MPLLPKRIETKFGNRTRVRVCAICLQEDDLLLVWHRGLSKLGSFIAPPGGGIHFGESAEDALQREVREETGLDIVPDQFLFVHEYVAPPLHAVELFFSVRINGGTLSTGTDPEMQQEEQLIERVQFVSPPDISEMIAVKKVEFHRMIEYCPHPKSLLSLRGYFKFDQKTRN